MSLDLKSGYGAVLAEHLARHRAALDATEARIGTAFLSAASATIAALKADRTVFFCGNGGSAADAQHLAAEFSVRFIETRPAFRAMTLAADPSAMTACANDFGFEQVFARQIEALGRPGDVLIALSTSGNSPNVLAALERARRAGLYAIAMTGASGGRAEAVADITLKVPAATTAAVQEMHITLGHALCHVVERSMKDRAELPVREIAS